MEKLTIEQIIEKYKEIEDKIPNIWPDFESAGRELEKDLYCHWDIKNSELIRVIALIGIRTKIELSKHIDTMCAFAGLYPEIMKPIKENLEGAEYGIKDELFFENFLSNMEKKLYRKNNEKL